MIRGRPHRHFRARPPATAPGHGVPRRRRALQGEPAGLRPARRRTSALCPESPPRRRGTPARARDRRGGACPGCAARQRCDRVGASRPGTRKSRAAADQAKLRRACPKEGESWQFGGRLSWTGSHPRLIRRRVETAVALPADLRCAIAPQQRVRDEIARTEPAVATRPCQRGATASHLRGERSNGGGAAARPPQSVMDELQLRQARRGKNISPSIPPSIKAPCTVLAPIRVQKLAPEEGLEPTTLRLTALPAASPTVPACPSESPFAIRIAHPRSPTGPAHPCATPGIR